MARIRRKYNTLTLPIPTLNERNRNYFSILDAQHSICIYRERGLTVCTCRVYEGKTIAEEAAMFNILQNHTPLTSAESFYSRYAARDEKALMLYEVVTSYGLEVRTQSNQRNTPNTVKCMGALYDLATNNTKAALELKRAQALRHDPSISQPWIFIGTTAEMEELNQAIGKVYGWLDRYVYYVKCNRVYRRYQDSKQDKKDENSVNAFLDAIAKKQFKRYVDVRGEWELKGCPSSTSRVFNERVWSLDPRSVEEFEKAILEGQFVRKQTK